MVSFFGVEPLPATWIFIDGSPQFVETRFAPKAV
jgi:hypothetical protein